MKDKEIEELTISLQEQEALTISWYNKTKQQAKEIERLTELCNKYEEEHKTTFEIWQKDIKENEHLRTTLNNKESIIKEVREYIEKHKETREHYEPFGTPMGNPNYITTHISGYYELLEILGRAEEE